LLRMQHSKHAAFPCSVKFHWWLASCQQLAALSQQQYLPAVLLQHFADIVVMRLWRLVRYGRTAHLQHQDGLQPQA
jgi:hypothetical protein